MGIEAIAPKPITQTTPSDVSQQQASVTVNGVTFSLATNNQGEGGGNQFSGKSSEQKIAILANVLFGKSNNSTKLLNELSATLAKAGIKSADIKVDSNGKIDITNLSKNDGSEPFGSLASFMDNRISNSLSPAQLDITAQLILSILSMASEARSEVIRMIIEAMEENHQQWLEVIKQMAEKTAENKAEAKALLEKLMSKIANGDVDAAKAVAALFAMLGVGVTTISINDIEKLNLSAKNDKDAITEFAKSQGLNLDNPKMDKQEWDAFINAVNEGNLDKAKKIVDATTTTGVIDYFQDFALRKQLGI